MIKFHKVSGKPAKVESGDENIWFSYPNGIYVADNQGNPRLISPGKMIGDAVPVGVPNEPGLFYYNTSNKKNYISTAEKWVEIGTGSIPGTGGGSNIAGNVLINDTANNYTSVDVEGALAEIAEKFPWYFGRMQLKDFNGDVNTLLKSTENYITTSAANRPNGKTGWLIQRKASNNNTYGFVIGDDGTAQTRVNDRFTPLAAQSDLAKLQNTVDSSLGELKVNVGKGLASDGKTLANGQTISLAQDILDKIDAAGAGANFVKKAGDTMTGSLVMKAGSGRVSQVQFSSTGSANNVAILDDPRGTSKNSPYGGREGGSRFRIANVKRNFDIMSAYSDGSVDIHANGPRAVFGNAGTNGRTTILNNNNNGKTSVDIVAPFSDVPLFVKGKNGQLHYKVNGGMNSLLSGNSSSGRKNLRIAGMGSNSELATLYFEAWNTRAKGKIHSGSAINVGFNHETSKGTGDGDVCLRIFPRKAGLNGEKNALRNYAVLYYEQYSQTLVVDSFKGNANFTRNERNNFVRLSSDGFITRSSVKYKNPIKKFEEDALSKVKEVTPELYAYKNDPKQSTQLGFIIEHGLPQEVVEMEGRGVNAYALTAYLWRATQQLSQEVDSLKEELENLRNS